jgi:glycosyltransferase involved in cell wall biosynthesis
LNQAEYLPSALHSLLSQRGAFDLECIVVDGGSTDATLDILRACGDRIRWTSGPDRGQSDALNKGFAVATGSIRGWLNSDDLLAPGALQCIVDVFAGEPQTQWLYGKVLIVDQDGRVIRRPVTAYKNWRMREFSYRRLLTENWISQMGVFWRAEAQALVGPFRGDRHLAMDYDYWLRLGAQWPGRFVNEYLGAFRWYPTTKTGGQSSQMLREELAVAQEHADGRFAREMLIHRINATRTRFVYALLRLRSPRSIERRAA